MTCHRSDIEGGGQLFGAARVMARARHVAPSDERDEGVATAAAAAGVAAAPAQPAMTMMHGLVLVVLIHIVHVVVSAVACPEDAADADEKRHTSAHGGGPRVPRS